jgi:hypothetical protein
MKRRPEEGQTLVERVVAWMDDPDREPWEDVALAVHRWQFTKAPVIRALTPAGCSKWQDIPAVPVELYRQLEVGTVMAADAPVSFHTSGTTSGAPGTHRLWDTQLYDEGSVKWAKACLGSLPRRVAATLSDPALSPHSSLAHMVGLWAPDDTTWHVVQGTLDTEALNARVATQAGPIFVVTTAFALADWLDGAPPGLPPGSRVMVTGGFKGRSREVTETVLYERAQRMLGADVVTEYGMTELSSQLWGKPGAPYVPPPWLRVRAINPVTRAVCHVGEPGQLQFFDLANVDSSLGVQTSDYGSVHADGAVTLLGRLPASEVRGCSLTLENDR